MKLLIISPNLPIPISGGRTRLYNFIKQLSRRHQLSLITFLQPDEQGHLHLLESFCRDIVTVPMDGHTPSNPWLNRLQGWAQILFSEQPRYAQTFPTARMRHPLRRLLEQESYDVVMFEQLFLVQLKAEIGDTPALLIEQNVESDIARRRFENARNPVHKVRDWLVWRRLAQYEQYWLSQFPVSVAVSAKDASRIMDIVPGVEVIVVPNGVDTQAFEPGDIQRSNDVVLFFGTLSYGPNIEGLLWFCRDIWPRVLAARPGSEFHIVGTGADRRIEQLAGLPGVRLSGYVADIREKLWSAAITVVPLLGGGGTRLKILESMAAACPVVSTSIGAEGLDVENGRHIAIADSAGDFVSVIKGLLASPDRREALACEARKLVEGKYDWQILVPMLEKACMRAIEVSPYNGDGERSARQEEVS